MPINNVSTSVTAETSVVAAVLQEVDALDCSRPGFIAVALALAALLDNPKATTSKPAAAGRLMQVLEKLRSQSGGRRGNLALVRTMTNKGGA